MFKIKDFPLNSIKGKICTQSYIKEFETAFLDLNFSLKPKMVMIILGIDRYFTYVYNDFTYLCANFLR